MLEGDIPAYVLNQKGFRVLSESDLDRLVEGLKQRNGRREPHLPIAAVPDLTTCSSAQLALLNALLDRGVRLTSLKRVIEERCRLHASSETTLPLPPPSRVQEMIIRLIDVLFALLGCLVFLVLVPFIALAICIDNGRPIFYVQERIGKGGRIFRLVKFRSMRREAEQDGPAWASDEDERLTRIGGFLRRWKLDEIPQFVNVLLGHMGMVGPRPIRPCFAKELAMELPHYEQRHLLRPGLTGWGTVRVGYGNSVELKYLTHQFDLYHLLHRTVRFDLEILARTAWLLMFRPSGLTPTETSGGRGVGPYLSSDRSES